MNAAEKLLPIPVSSRQVPGEAGIWIFILSDMLMFSLLFILFTWDQTAGREIFRESQARLHVSMGLINTILLLTSSWFVVLSVRCAKQASWQWFSRFIVLSILCGTAFLIIKTVEYIAVIEQGYSLLSDIFFSYYFIITGIHFLHVIIGLVALTCLWRGVSRCGAIKDARLIENTASYWHMVDLLWIAIFPVIYLIR